MNGLVVVSLIGGLGNQLFQFAAAKGLQRDCGAPVVVDTRLAVEWPNRLPTVLRDDSFRDVTQRELIRLRQIPRLKIAQRTLIDHREAVARRWPALRLDGREFKEASPTAFDPASIECEAPVLLRGYFQSERYFEGVGEEVRASFQSATADAAKRLKEVLRTNRPLVGISLRTGPDYANFDLVLPRSYYDHAVEVLLSHFGDVSFVVFGDVPVDCAVFAASLRSRGPALSVADASPRSQLDMMRMMQHLVLSNSSFAWWGAWLGDSAFDLSDPRVVIAPDPWWTQPDDIAPERWLRVRHSGFETRSVEVADGVADRRSMINRSGAAR